MSGCLRTGLSSRHTGSVPDASSCPWLWHIPDTFYDKLPRDMRSYHRSHLGDVLITFGANRDKLLHVIILTVELIMLCVRDKSCKYDVSKKIFKKFVYPGPPGSSHKRCRWNDARDRGAPRPSWRGRWCPQSRRCTPWRSCWQWWWSGVVRPQLTISGATSHCQDGGNTLGTLPTQNKSRVAGKSKADRNKTRKICTFFKFYLFKSCLKAPIHLPKICHFLWNSRLPITFIFLEMNLLAGILCSQIRLSL